MIAYRGHDPVTCTSREWSVNCGDRVYTVGVGRLPNGYIAYCCIDRYPQPGTVAPESRGR